MKRSDAQQHHRAVEAFFELAAQQNPERYAEVCAKYPVLTMSQARLIRYREQAAGLIGAQPTENLPSHIAELYGYEVVAAEE
jgi:hypothetical protein